MKHIHKILENGGTPLDIDINVDDNQFYVQLASQAQCQCDERVKRLVFKSCKGFQSGHSPTLCDNGVGGTYFMHDAHNKLVAVFKPHDEEFGCSNNPKGFTPQDHYLDDCMRHGVNKGEAAFRECAAYILDHNHFSGVPATDLVICNFPSFQNNSPPQHLDDEDVKFGSFQEFKEHDFDAEDIGPSKAALFPVREVHKIAILDIRLFNTDRHGGNILVKQVDTHSTSGSSSDSDLDAGLESLEMQFQMDDDYGEEDEEEDLPTKPCPTVYELIPIDHGYILPNSLSALSDSRFEWLNWPQSKVTFDNATMTYIDSLDPHVDIALLKDRFPDRFSLESLNVLLISALWLKVAAAQGLSAHEIGCAMIRLDSEQPSKLEEMCKQAFGDNGASTLESVIIDNNIEAALTQSMKDKCLSLCQLRDAQGMLRPRPRSSS